MYSKQEKPIFFRPGVLALGLIAAGRIQTAPAADLPELSRRYPQEKRPGTVRLPERVVFYAVFGVVRYSARIPAKPSVNSSESSGAVPRTCSASFVAA